MIYLYCIKEDLHLYQEYIEILVKNYICLKYINLHNINEIINYIHANDLEYLDHIIIGDINEYIVNQLMGKNIIFYLLHTNIIKSEEELEYLLNKNIKKNKNIKIITYNYNFIKYFKKYIEKIYYLPVQINDLKKTSDKIFINNANDGLLNENICYNNIYNRIIIINDKRILFDNLFLNNYIFDINYKLIDNFKTYALNNYDIITNIIYEEPQLEYNNNLIKNISNDFFKEISEINKFGFIILRHVNSEITNKYWIESYNSIRNFYREKIIIIDDGSNNEYLKNDIDLIDCYVINSEFKKRGEILPYYYLYKYKFFEQVVIIHDSVFIKKYINFKEYKKIKFIWHFTHHWDNEVEELKLLNVLENKELIEFHKDKEKWTGCYGVQSVIDLNFLEEIQNKYNIFKLIMHINNRDDRMNFERIFGLICMYSTEMSIKPSIYGIIHHYIHWGYQFTNYLEDSKNNSIDHLDIVKVWSGR